ncbi:MAG: hypothetical protein JWR37_493 [Mycobacterium sp.]|nr:hypothetical protein [Mycobacterium sp.]
MNLAIKRHVEQVRRRWWLVLLVTGLAVVAALASQPVHTTYVGKSTLVQSSPGRSPDQDIITVIGYATLFNDPATQDRLRVKKSIPKDVTLDARTVPGSSILTVEATATDPEVAQHAATSMAAAFREDLTPPGQITLDSAIADIQRQLLELQQSFPDTAALTQKATSLQDNIDSLRFSLTNRLYDLQPEAGVRQVPPRLAYNLALGAAGGLLLGILAAVGMAAVSTRISSSTDLREKTAIEPLVEVPSARSVRQSALREDRIRTLANIVSSQDSPGSFVIALTDSRGVRGAAGIAEALAKVLAQQEYRTVLVFADDDASQSAENAGLNRVLRDTKVIHQMLHDGEVESLKMLLWPGLFANRYSRMTRERIVAILDELRVGTDIIVIAAPSLADSTDAQLLGAAADSTVVVVDTESSRAGDVTSAVDVLGRARAEFLGVVLVHGTYAQSARSTFSTRWPSSPANETPGQGSAPRHTHTGA